MGAAYYWEGKAWSCQLVIELCRYRKNHSPMQNGEMPNSVKCYSDPCCPTKCGHLNGGNIDTYLWSSSLKVLRTRITAGQEIYFLKYFSTSCSFSFSSFFLTLSGSSGGLFSGALVLIVGGPEPEGIGSCGQRLG